MPFLQSNKDGIAIGEVDGEDAIRFVDADGSPLLTAIEAEVPRLSRHVFGPTTDVGARFIVGGQEVFLEATHVHVLSHFLLSHFIIEPVEQLRTIRDATAFAIGKLEEWNERARSDEEHPPYVDITDRLRVIEYALGQLARGLVPSDDRDQFGA